MAVPSPTPEGENHGILQRDPREAWHIASPAAANHPPPQCALVAVVVQLEQRAAANPQELNWRTTIVALLKLLDIDSSFVARKELATELGWAADLTEDSAKKVNIRLRSTGLPRIAANGGNAPKELLD